MKITRILYFMTLFLVLCSWGERGHLKINGLSPIFFPPELNNFKGWSDILSSHGSDADNRKRYGHTEGIKHYIDIDAYVDFVEKHKIIESKSDAYRKYGKEFILKMVLYPGPQIQPITSW